MDIFDAAALMGAVPLLWLTLRYWIGRRVEGEAWSLAAALAVSVVADVVIRAHPAWQWVVSPVYLVSQAALMVGALLPGLLAWPMLVLLVAAGEAAILFGVGQGPDVFLHTVAFGLVLGAAWIQSSRYRWALSAYFGAGLLSWWWYAGHPAWASWVAFQSCRALGVILFCWASVE